MKYYACKKDVSIVTRIVTRWLISVDISVDIILRHSFVPRRITASHPTHVRVT
jgi:hypothetical protein